MPRRKLFYNRDVNQMKLGFPEWHREEDIMRGNEVYGEFLADKSFFYFILII